MVMEEYSYNSTHPLGHTGPVTGSLYLYLLYKIIGLVIPCPVIINFSVKFIYLMWWNHNNVISYTQTYCFHPIIHSIFIPSWLLLLSYPSLTNCQQITMSLLICTSSQLNTKIEKHLHLPPTTRIFIFIPHCFNNVLEYINPYPANVENMVSS